MIRIFSLFAIIALARADDYCAVMSSDEAAGASGYFRMGVSNGVAQYSFYLDLTDFSTSCDLTSGLPYHLHSFWNNGTSASAANDNCGSSNTGGHFDPNLACGTASQSSSTNCPPINRTVDTGYTYSCSYSTGAYATCEVGDWAGKFGNAMETSTGSKIFEQSSELNDYLPPYVANYKASDDITDMWASVVFHCSTGSRLVCGEFVQTSDLSACGVTTSSSGDNDNDDDGPLATWGALMIGVGVLLVFVLLGMCVSGGGGKDGDISNAENRETNGMVTKNEKLSIMAL